jgi:broad specificity phosphatase PhoE
MPPQKIMVIRHAEKPIDGGAKGIDPQGTLNSRSLTVRGWQRTGALTRFFSAPSTAMILSPDMIYATGTGPDNPSRRSIDTAEPIAAKLGCRLVTNFLKHECDAVAAEVMRQSGTVLIVWEHKMLPALIRAFPRALAATSV